MSFRRCAVCGALVLTLLSGLGTRHDPEAHSEGPASPWRISRAGDVVVSSSSSFILRSKLSGRPTSRAVTHS